MNSLIQFPLMQRTLLEFENEQFSYQFCIFPSEFVFEGLGV